MPKFTLFLFLLLCAQFLFSLVPTQAKDIVSKKSPHIITKYSKKKVSRFHQIGLSYAVNLIVAIPINDLETLAKHGKKIGVYLVYKSLPKISYIKKANPDGYIILNKDSDNVHLFEIIPNIENQIKSDSLDRSKLKMISDGVIVEPHIYAYSLVGEDQTDLQELHYLDYQAKLSPKNATDIMINCKL